MSLSASHDLPDSKTAGRCLTARAGIMSLLVHALLNMQLLLSAAEVSERGNLKGRVCVLFKTNHRMRKFRLSV